MSGGVQLSAGQNADIPAHILVSSFPSSDRIFPLTGSFFKTLTDQVITVELKNDLCITGTLKSVDQ